MSPNPEIPQVRGADTRGFARHLRREGKVSGLEVVCGESYGTLLTRPSQEHCHVPCGGRKRDRQRYRSSDDEGPQGREHLPELLRGMR